MTQADLARLGLIVAEVQIRLALDRVAADLQRIIRNGATR